MITYGLSPDGLQIRLLGIRIIDVQFDDIAEVRRVSFRESLPLNLEMFTAIRFGNRVWGDIVLVKRKRGFFRRYLISPDDADDFIETIQRHSPAHLPPWVAGTATILVW